MIGGSTTSIGSSVREALLPAVERATDYARCERDVLATLDQLATTVPDATGSPKPLWVHMTSDPRALLRDPSSVEHARIGASLIDTLDHQHEHMRHTSRELGRDLARLGDAIEADHAAPATVREDVQTELWRLRSALPRTDHDNFRSGYNDYYDDYEAELRFVPAEMRSRMDHLLRGTTSPDLHARAVNVSGLTSVISKGEQLVEGLTRLQGAADYRAVAGDVADVSSPGLVELASPTRRGILAAGLRTGIERARVVAEHENALAGATDHQLFTSGDGMREAMGRIVRDAEAAGLTRPDGKLAIEETLFDYTLARSTHVAAAQRLDSTIDEVLAPFDMTRVPEIPTRTTNLDAMAGLLHRLPDEDVQRLTALLTRLHADTAAFATADRSVGSAAGSLTMALEEVAKQAKLSTRAEALLPSVLAEIVPAHRPVDTGRATVFIEDGTTVHRSRMQVLASGRSLLGEIEELLREQLRGEAPTRLLEDLPVPDTAHRTRKTSATPVAELEYSSNSSTPKAVRRAMVSEALWSVQRDARDGAHRSFEMPSFAPGLERLHSLVQAQAAQETDMLRLADSLRAPRTTHAAIEGRP